MTARRDLRSATMPTCTHRAQNEDAGDAANISTAIVTVGARAKFNTFSLTTGGSRQPLADASSPGWRGSELSTNSVHLLRGKRHLDTTFVIDHAAPDCLSRELFSAVLDVARIRCSRARSTSNQIAQKTDGKMMRGRCCCPDEAEIDNKPELEIFADDVQCGHGATIGALDDRPSVLSAGSRHSGGRREALLIQAFVGEALESIVNERSARRLRISAAERWLEDRRA